MNVATRTRALSLIGIALLVAACADTSGTDSAREEAVDRDPTNAGSNEETDKRTDARESLSAIQGAEKWRRGADLMADARAYAAHVAQSVGVQDPRFADFKAAKGTDGRMHVRLDQMFKGVKVWGADVVVHATDAELVGATGMVASAIDPSLDMTAKLDEASALDLAKTTRFGKKQFTNVPERDSVERIVYVDSTGAAHLAFHTVFYTELNGDQAPGLWNHVIDAKTGKVLARWNGIDTAIAQGSGPGGNPKYTHTWNDELDVESNASGYVMSTAAQKTINMNTSQSGAGTEVTSSTLGGFSDAAINDAHGYAEITLKMLASMGHNSIDDSGFKIISRVHYGVQYENAFWNGAQMTYGDGKTYFHPLSGALDVVAHEIHHGFTSKHSNLAYSGEPGGLNESFSDVAGKVAEFFYKATPNWDLGGDIFKNNGALRYMCDPPKDGSSIDHASKMTPSLDPHYSSGPPNKAFCRLSKRLSSGDPAGTATKEGVKRAATAFYLANANYWTSSTSFIQGCQGTVDAARALDYSTTEVAAIKASWADVGVYCDGAPAPPPACDETLTGASGSVTSPNYPAQYGNNLNKTWCIEAPAGSEATLTFDEMETESGYDFVSVAGKNGAFGTKTSGTTKPTSVTSSRIYLNFKSDSVITKKGWKASWTSN